MTVGEIQREFVETALRRRDPRVQRGCKGTGSANGPEVNAGQLPLNLVPAIHSLAQLQFRLPQILPDALQALVVVAGLARQQSGVLASKICQALLGGLQPLFVDLDLLVQKTLRHVGIDARVADEPLYKGVEQGLHHLEGLTGVRRGVGDGIQVLATVVALNAQVSAQPVNQFLDFLLGEGLQMHVRGTRHLFEVRAREEGAGQHVHALIGVWLDRQARQQRPENGFGIHVHLRRDPVLVRHLADVHPTRHGYRPGNHQGHPAISPHATHVGEDLGQHFIHTALSSNAPGTTGRRPDGTGTDL
jgi:hypothetical protein